VYLVLLSYCKEAAAMGRPKAKLMRLWIHDMVFPNKASQSAIDTPLEYHSTNMTPRSAERAWEKRAIHGSSLDAHVEYSLCPALQGS
jgi:hypothetical protein